MIKKNLIIIILFVFICSHDLDDNELDYILDLFNENRYQNISSKEITVYTWQNNYPNNLIPSVSFYLFENLKINENIAPKTNQNRPGKIYPKYYITIHDTGDIEYGAKQWSDTVYSAWNNQSNDVYNNSFHYVVGNDGIYHNIPDNENAKHAGDGQNDGYNLTDSGVFVNNKITNPKVSISSDGYYEINGEKTIVKVPLKPDNNNQSNLIPNTSEINDQGIRIVDNIDDTYFIGNTYYNDIFNKVSNYGGNLNSIGIESCVNNGSDIYYTWQLSAKLIAKLMYDNSLTINDLKPHHFFSGKNCPMTMRENSLYKHFLQLVSFESEVLNFINEGYEIKFNCDSPFVDKNGRIKNIKEDIDIEYTITVKKNKNEKTRKYSIKLLSNNKNYYFIDY
jgi:N-acetylmuramoyl-L-alanine amidase CwlA